MSKLYKKINKEIDSFSAMLIEVMNFLRISITKTMKDRQILNESILIDIIRIIIEAPTSSLEVMVNNDS
jgi:hypothetical protein